MSDTQHECKEAQFISHIGWVVNVETYQRLERLLISAEVENARLLSELAKLGSMERHMNICREIIGCPDDETLVVHLEGMKGQRSEALVAVIEGGKGEE